MSDLEANKAVIRKFTRVFKNEHNVDIVDSLFSPAFKHNFHMPVAPGREGFKAMGSMMNGAFPDVVVTENDLIASGDKVVERSSAVATHGGDLMGIKATGKQVRWTEIHIYQLREGKIVEHWVELSMLELLDQLRAQQSP